MKPATVISKLRGDEPEVHYLIGPQRATRAEAEQDLRIFNAATASPPNEPDCPGEGCCHGPVSWCPSCGEVREVCDDRQCAVHRCEFCGGMHPSLVHLAGSADRSSFGNRHPGGRRVTPRQEAEQKVREAAQLSRDLGAQVAAWREDTVENGEPIDLDAAEGVLIALRLAVLAVERAR